MTPLHMLQRFPQAARASLGPSVLLLLAALGGAGVVMLAQSQRQPRMEGPGLGEDTIARVVEQRSPAVVFLHTVSERAAGRVLPPGVSGPLFFPPTEGLGSGVIIDGSGLVLTNAHVVAGAGTIHVRRPGERDVEAAVVGTDPDLDLALLRMSGSGPWMAAPLGDSDRVRVGQWVVAIGNPFGLHHTVTHGIVSAKGRAVSDSDIELLQTDAAVNPGNSGGPLFDLSGRVIALTTAVYSERGDNIGLNFAIPINVVKQALPELRQGRSTRGWIGLAAIELSAEGREALGLEGHQSALLITRLEEGPATRAGLRVGDVILGLAGPPPVPASEMRRHIRALRPGDAARVIVWRNGRTQQIDLIVAQNPRS